MCVYNTLSALGRLSYPQNNLNKKLICTPILQKRKPKLITAKEPAKVMQQVDDGPVFDGDR